MNSEEAQIEKINTRLEEHDAALDEANKVRDRVTALEAENKTLKTAAKAIVELIETLSESVMPGPGETANANRVRFRKQLQKLTDLLQ
jgi:uncharacterized coiled-coil DUF342 family protein